MGIEPTSEPWEATVCSHQYKEIPEFQLLPRPEIEFFTGWAQVLVHCAVGSDDHLSEAAGKCHRPGTEFRCAIRV